MFSDVSASSSRESAKGKLFELCQRQLFSTLFLRSCTDLLFSAVTGLESSGILDNISPKCTPTTFTQADRKKYLRRAKIFSYAWRNQRKRDLVTFMSHYSLNNSFTDERRPGK
jgi:hypothetical protein